MASGQTVPTVTSQTMPAKRVLTAAGFARDGLLGVSGKAGALVAQRSPVSEADKLEFPFSFVFWCIVGECEHDFIGGTHELQAHQANRTSPLAQFRSGSDSGCTRLAEQFRKKVVDYRSL